MQTAHGCNVVKAGLRCSFLSVFWIAVVYGLAGVQALSSKVHQQLLALPAAAMCPELTAHMCAVMRHLLEDPATLLAAMEAEIRATLSPHRGTGAPLISHVVQLLRLWPTTPLSVLVACEHALPEELESISGLTCDNLNTSWN